MDTGILADILEVVESVGQWVVESVQALMPMFYTAATDTAPGGLTILGILAISGLSLSIIFLLLGFIQNFLHFRS